MTRQKDAPKRPAVPDAAAIQAWAKRQVDKAPPATPQQVAAVRRALLPQHRRRDSA